MQHQNIDQSRVLKREDELTDISKMPLSQVKPQEGRVEQPGSQRSTMQSVSMGEVPASGNEETILGSVASIHDQMQPGSFMSPISDRKSGSLEGLSAEKKATAESAINTFAHKAAEKIEEFVHAAQDFAHVAADKIAEFARDLTCEPTKGDVQELTRTVQAGAQELKNEVVKKAYLVRRSITRKLGKRGERLEKKAGLAAGIAKVYAKEQLKDAKRKTRRYARSIDLNAKLGKASLKKDQKNLEGKLRSFQRDFEKEASLAGETLRRGAFELRQRARQILNDLPRNAQIAKDSFISEIKAELQPSTQALSTQSTSGSKFLLEIPSSEWNGRTQSRPQFYRRGYAQRREGEGFEASPSKFLMEFSAHDWNESSALLSRQQAGFLMSKAQDYLTRASKQYHSAQRRYVPDRYMRGARKYYKEAMRKGEEISTMIKGQVNELVDQATKRFADSTSYKPAQNLKQRPQGFIDRAAEKGKEILGDLDEVKDAARRKLIEKKAEVEFQAELLTKDKFPSQEALSKKQAINSEIRNLYGKENLSQ